jgi:predicted Fe-Mo cluster-binding NifX family protein
MRTAVTIWKDRVSPVFDVSRKILVLDIEDATVTASRIESFSGDDPHYKLARLRELCVQTLICGAISKQMAERLKDGGIQLISFVSGDRKAVVAAHLDGRLPNEDLSMPGRARWSNRQRAVASRRGHNRK